MPKETQKVVTSEVNHTIFVDVTQYAEEDDEMVDPELVKIEKGKQFMDPDKIKLAKKAEVVRQYLPEKDGGTAEDPKLHIG